MHILIGVIEKQGHWELAVEHMYPLLYTDIDYFTEVHDNACEDELYGIVRPYGIETDQETIRNTLQSKKQDEAVYYFDAHM